MTPPPMRRHDLLRWAAAQLTPADADPAGHASPSIDPRDDALPPLPASPPLPPGTPSRTHAASPAGRLTSSSGSTHTGTCPRQRPALPPLLRWASRIDAWPPALWMSLQALALWPVLRWALQRFAAEPAALLCLLPLTLLAIAAARGRLSCDWPARPPWLASSAVLSLAITAGNGLLAWPVLACAAALAAGCSWAAFCKPGTPVLPVLGLLVLALPLDIIDPTQGFRPDGVLLLPAWLPWLAACTACAAALWNRVPTLRFEARQHKEPHDEAC